MAERAVAMAAASRQAAGQTRGGWLLWNPQLHRRAVRPKRAQPPRESCSARRIAAGAPAGCSEPAGAPLVVAWFAVSFDRAMLAMSEPTSTKGSRARLAGPARLSVDVGRSDRLSASASLGEADATGKNSLAAVCLRVERKVQAHSMSFRSCSSVDVAWAGPSCGARGDARREPSGPARRFCLRRPKLVFRMVVSRFTRVFAF